MLTTPGGAVVTAVTDQGAETDRRRRVDYRGSDLGHGRRWRPRSRYRAPAQFRSTASWAIPRSLPAAAISRSDRSAARCTARPAAANITVNRVGGEAVLETNGGDIVAHTRGGTVHAQTGGGGVRIGTAGGAVTAVSGGGEIVVEKAGGIVTLRNMAGPGERRLGHGRALRLREAAASAWPISRVRCAWRRPWAASTPACSAAGSAILTWRPGMVTLRC